MSHCKSTLFLLCNTLQSAVFATVPCLWPRGNRSCRGGGADLARSRKRVEIFFWRKKL